MYLENYKTTVIQSLHTVGQMTETTYTVDYEIGTCVYTYRKVGRRIKQEVLQLINCDMWKVITLINEDNKLTEGDLTNLNMEIRTHSLDKVTEFINGQGRNQ